MNTMNKTTLSSKALLCCLSLALISPPLLVSFAPHADARAGSGRSMGSRGSRTYSSGSFGGHSIQRSMTSPSSSSSGFSGYNSGSSTYRPAQPPMPPMAPRPAPAPTQPASGGSFLKGVAGGVAGAAAYNMLTGGNKSHAQETTGNTANNNNAPQQNPSQDVTNQAQNAPNPSYSQQAEKKNGNTVGILIRVLIVVLIIWLAIRYFRKRQQPAQQNGNASNTHPMSPINQYIKDTNIQLDQNDYTTFQQRLYEVQNAWDKQDLLTLQKLCTPEMASYFNEQLTELASQGLRNQVSNLQFQQGDLAEAWTEGMREYATVSMRYSLIDVTTDSNGTVVKGNPNQPETVTEYWTFVRNVNNKNWLLSAIQQQK